MLRNSRLPLVLAGIGIPALIAFGCTVQSTNTNPSSGATSDVGVGVGATVTATVGATTGAGGSGGTTIAGVGGGTATGVGGSGSGGGTCVDPAGTGSPVDADCDKIPSAQAIPTCGGGGGAGGGGSDPPPDPGVCHQGFKVYTTGSAELLASCLAAIPIGPSGNNCSDADNGGPIQACVRQMYDRACPNPQASTACAAIQTACGTEPFDVTKCGADIIVFNDAAVQSLADCMNANTTDPCQTVYDGCFTQVTTVQ